MKHTGLGRDETTQMVTASEEVWASMVAVCYIYYPNSLHIFFCNFLFHVSRILMYILSFQGDSKAVALRKKGCPNYDKLKQLFAPNTATGSLQISLNTPTLDSDEECALEEELANEACCTQLGDDDCYNPNMKGITQDDPPVDEQTQHVNTRPMEEPTTKGKKVAKKMDRASEMTMALQEYIALGRERFSNKKGKSSGSSDHVAQSASGG